MNRISCFLSSIATIFVATLRGMRPSTRNNLCHIQNTTRSIAVRSPHGASAGLACGTTCLPLCKLSLDGSWRRCSTAGAGVFGAIAVLMTATHNSTNCSWGGSIEKNSQDVLPPPDPTVFVNWCVVVMIMLSEVVVDGRAWHICRSSEVIEASLQKGYGLGLGPEPPTLGWWGAARCKR